MKTKKKLFSILKKMPVSIAGPLFRKRVLLNDDSTKDIEFKIADTKDELEQAYKLVYKVYAKENIIKSTQESLRLKLVNANPHTTVFIAKKENRVIMTMSLYPDSALGLPIDQLYKKEVNKLRNQGRYIAEVGAFASAIAYRKNNQTLPFLMNKIMHTYAAEYLKIDDLLIAVNKKHVWVYKNLLLFKQIGKEKYYADKDICQYPLIPLRLALETSRDRYRKAYKNYPSHNNLFHFFFHKNNTNISLPNERRPYYIWSKELLSYFFEEKTNLLQQAPQLIKEHILSLHLQINELKSFSA